MVKRILVALSGTPFTPVAVRHAIELARKHGASITGTTVVDIERISDVGPIPLGGGAAAHALTEHRALITQERIEQEIINFEEACRNASVDHAVDREKGDAFELLRSLWRYHDLTIMGLRGLFEYGIVHNPDDHIIRLIKHGVRPILAVSPEYRPIQRVLIAYNGSAESAMAMKRFAQLRLWPDATIRICSFGFDDDTALALLTDATKYLRAHGFDPEAENMPGYPEKGLLKHSAEWKADMVVMGATSRGRIAKLVLGETALEALMHANEPLFLSQ